MYTSEQNFARIQKLELSSVLEIFLNILFQKSNTLENKSSIASKYILKILDLLQTGSFYRFFAPSAI